MSYSHYDLYQQAQSVNTYGAGQNREPGLQYVQSTYTPEYIGSQGQIHSASFQDQTYQSVKPPDNAAASFGPNVPGYHAQSSPLAAHAGPWNTGLCRYPNCHHPAARDEGTQELTEYCSLEHMRDDLRRGVPPCPACNRCPRRISGNYCGSSCERWDTQRQQQPQHQRYYPPSGVRPHLLVPSSGNVIWNIPTGHVRCPRCGTTYSPQGSRNQPQYETGTTLPACPSLTN
ncbi:hypothetical protein BJV77DRAFT_545453 [Russula vinacea]|nr:hypothetical protein BJV77DRAFT_545453 [Russula vinacea]